MVTQRWQYSQWVANFCYAFSALMLVSPNIASHNLTPWFLYFVANLIWMADSIMHKNWPWVWLASYFCVWDIVTGASRLYGVDLFPYLAPTLTLLETLP